MKTQRIVFSALALWAVAAAAAPPTAIRSDGITRLYGAGAALEGGLRLQKGPNWILEDNTGSLKWEISAGEAREYEVSVCYAAKAEVPIAVQAGEASLTASLRPTSGVFQDDLMNFERVELAGRLRLDPATRSLTLQLQSAPPSAMRLRSVELVPVSARAAIDREAERARKARASTDWLIKAGYGVMFHWTSRSAPRHGPAKTYAEAVAAFDVPVFGRMVEETGAGYVIFTVNHAEPHCPAPIASGSTRTRAAPRSAILLERSRTNSRNATSGSCSTSRRTRSVDCAIPPPRSTGRFTSRCCPSSGGGMAGAFPDTGSTAGIRRWSNFRSCRWMRSRPW